MNPHPKIHPRLHKEEFLRRCRLEECNGACRLHGAWVDLALHKEITRNAGLISSLLPGIWADPESWFQPEIEEDTHSLSGKVIQTIVIDNEEHYGGTACIFWLLDAKCALQVAAENSGLHPWRFKPFYCILHPLILDEEGRITLDETDKVTNEPASCLRPSDVSQSLTVTFKDELDYLLKLE